MEIIIRETGERQTLSITSPATGVDFIADFVGNTGALQREFAWDEELDAYVCGQEDYDWWKRVVEDNQALEWREYRLVQEHGWEAVEAAQDAAGVGYEDLEDHAAAYNWAYDEAFGEDEG